MATQELKANVSVDARDAAKQFDSLSGKVKGVSAAAEGAGKGFDLAAGAVDDASQAMARSMQAFADSTTGAVGKVTAGMDGIKSSVKDASANITTYGSAIAASTDKIVKAVEKSGKSKGGIFGGLVTFHSLKKGIMMAVDAVSDYVKGLGRISDGSKALGVSAEYFQQLEQASKNTGVSFEDTQKAFSRVNDVAAAALSGDADAAAKFQAIGLSVDDLRGKSPEQIFELANRAMSEMSAEGLDAQAKLDLLGESAKTLEGHFGDLANASNIEDGIVKQKDVDAGADLVKDFEALQKSFTNLIHSGLAEYIAKAIGYIKEALDLVNSTIEAHRQARESSKAVAEIPKDLNSPEGRAYIKRKKAEAWARAAKLKTESSVESRAEMRSQAQSEQQAKNGAELLATDREKAQSGIDAKYEEMRKSGKYSQSALDAWKKREMAKTAGMQTGDEKLKEELALSGMSKEERDRYKLKKEYESKKASGEYSEEVLEQWYKAQLEALEKSLKDKGAENILKDVHSSIKSADTAARSNAEKQLTAMKIRDKGKQENGERRRVMHVADPYGDATYNLGSRKREGETGVAARASASGVSQSARRTSPGVSKAAAAAPSKVVSGIASTVSNIYNLLKTMHPLKVK